MNEAVIYITQLLHPHAPTDSALREYGIVIGLAQGLESGKSSTH